MINWYLLGDISTLKSDERTRFFTGQIIEGRNPEIILSGTVNEYGDTVETKSLIIFGGEHLPVPTDRAKVYVTRSDKYALRFVGTNLQLGVKENA